MINTNLMVFSKYYLCCSNKFASPDLFPAGTPSAVRAVRVEAQSVRVQLSAAARARNREGQRCGPQRALTNPPTMILSAHFEAVS